MSIETLGGYRIVRKLGEGARADVLLGYPQLEGFDGSSAAIKVYRPGVSHASAVAEAEALSRAWGSHVVELLDLSTSPDGTPALLLGRLSGHSLTRVLAERPTVRVGEAITILAPIATTVSRLHQAGVVHGAVRADAVLFDEVGAPVLACFGSATLMSPGQSRAALEANAGVTADIDAVRALARAVLERVHDDGAAKLSEWVAAPDRPAGAELLDAFVTRLFELGEPEPVAFGSPTVRASATPNRAIIAEPVRETATQTALALPQWATRYLPTGESVTRLRAAIATVRPRLWVISGAVGAALVAAVLLVPAGGSDATPQPSVASTPLPESTSTPGDPAVAGDDPAAALLALLAIRDHCVQQASVLCLDSVGQPGSAALADDQQLIRDLQAGSELPPTWSVDEVVVDERMGGSALVSIIEPEESEPASILLVKGEAGWRIRDYVWL